MAEVPVNWCPALGTVLANEEVTNEGRSDRGNHPVYRRALKQWMLRITSYAERLVDDLKFVDWPESIKIMQRNWIGSSEGAEVNFSGSQVSGFRFSCLHHAARHAVRRDVHGARAGASAGRRNHHAGTARRRSIVRGGSGPQVRARAHGRHEGEDRRLHRRVRDQPGEPAADPDLGRGLRDDGLRHRRDHGRAGARHARLRVRAEVQSPDHPGRPAAGRHRLARLRGRRHRGQLRQVRRPADVRVQKDDHGRSRSRRAREVCRELQAARLDLQPPVVLGRAVPDRALRDRAERSDCRKISFRCCCRTWRISRRRPATIRTLRRSRRWGA